MGGITSNPQPPEPQATHATGDSQFLTTWLGVKAKSPHTRRAYEREAAAFLAFIHPRSLKAVTIDDVLVYRDWLQTRPSRLAPSSLAYKLSVVRSMLAYGHRIGFLLYNVGAGVDIQTPRATLADRILTEAEIIRLIDAADRRSPDHAFILRLLYYTGMRVSELCGLRSADIQPHGENSGQLAIHGKGGKTRYVLIDHPKIWEGLQARKSPNPTDTILRTRNGHQLHENQVRRMVAKAAKDANIRGGKVSPHFLRHSHVSHALDRGAPVHLVRTVAGHASLETVSRYAHAKPSETSGSWLVV